MALILHLKYAESLKGKSDRLAKVSFRGVFHYTEVVEDAEGSAFFDQTFQWPVARPIEKDEVIEIQLFNYNRYLSNRLVGIFRMFLQELVEVGNVKICDSLLDTNNVVMKTTVTFELVYNAPDGSVGMWQRGGFDRLTSEELRSPLTEEDQNLRNLEHSSLDSESIISMGSPTKSIHGSKLSLDSKRSGGKSPRHTKNLSSVVKLMMNVSRQRAGAPDADDRQSLIDDLETDPSLDAKAAEIASMVGGGKDSNLDDDQQSEGRGSISAGSISFKRSKDKVPRIEPISMKAQDFQVCITVIEARQLAGLNMDPVVCVQVGDQKKYTSVKESTNCPYYSEYFVFDFHMAPAMLFDKIVTLTVCQSGRLLRSNKPLGHYKLDVGTVYAASDHQFYHKWAMLTDPDDINGGVKGYLKCDIAVVGKGDSIKVPPRMEQDDDDIEGNLLLPEGVPADRQRAKFCINVYKAEGLPKMNTGIMANVKRAFTGESKDLVDPYVNVSFAGHQGRTTVKKGCYEPEWNEQIIFTEMFPPLCRRIQIQLRDKDKVNDDVIGTHYIDIAKISNEGEKGFLPTYGPCWVNLYGSTRQYSLLNDNQHLNDGLGEGVSYRGRMLISLRTEVIESADLGGPATVEVCSSLPIPENAAGKLDEFFLFGCFMEASMIDKRLGEKPVHFEISLGNAGNVLDGYNPPTKKSSSSSDESESEEETADDAPLLSEVSVDTPKWKSTTPILRPSTKDKMYYHLPYYEDKPCVYIKHAVEDHRRRMYNSNIVDRIVEKLDDGICEVHEMIVQEQPFPEKRMRGVFEELGSACSKFVSIVKGTQASGKTKLDKERQKLLIREMDHFSTSARTMKTTTSKHNLKEKLKVANQYLQKLKSLSHEPQHALPDVFIWMISGNKRIAYQRIPAREVIYSIVEEERGKNCGKQQILLLRLPGKKATGQSGWGIQAKLHMYLWLGLSKHKKDFLNGLPKGYDESRMVQIANKPHSVPPEFIHYSDSESFQVRCHMYQARSLIGSDASGLSDPFARVAFGDQSVCTQVIEETLSPTWDEMMIINEVTVYGQVDEIVSNPPLIIIEVFDQDKVGKSEFIGRAMAKPVVKMKDEKYDMPKFPPRLEWWDIYRGPDKAGQLLACFELLQHPFEEKDLRSAHLTPPYARKTNLLASLGEMTGQDLPPLELPTGEKDRGPVMPVPKGIRPILSKHRIEVLFWGVRDLKRVQLTSVDKPRIDIECAGHVLASSVIQNYKKNPNFGTPVKFFDVELPENELYCPPITIRCVDCRNFGRYVLVGTHVINSIHKFMYVPTTKKAKAALQKLFPGKDPDAPKIIETRPTGTVKIEDINMKQKKTEENSRRKKKDSIEDDEEMDLESMDWWSKYFASVETLIREHERNREDNFNNLDIYNRTENHSSESRSMTPYGAISNENASGNPAQNQTDDDPDFNPKEAKKLEKQMEKQDEQKKTFRGAAKAVSLASKLSPKSQQKKSNTPAAAQLKTRKTGLGLLNSAFDMSEEEAEPGQKKKALPPRKFRRLNSELKVYPNELEGQNEYEGFKDWLHTFELLRGKRSATEDTDESRIVGKFKGSLKIYKIPLPDDIEDTTITGGDPSCGLFQGLPSNDPIKVLVRVYVVKANDLHPADLNGKADPYMVIKLGSTTINDKENYVSKQLNPMFGKCFEIESTFPMESLLTVQIYDWDLVGMDDLIGETKIDLENRYYSRHRAVCGISAKYDPYGYNSWRDPIKPTQILTKLCKDGKVDGPHYQPGKVRVGNRIFTGTIDHTDDQESRKNHEEQLALSVLRQWEEIPKVGCKLVPEHVETRPLFNPEKPGIEQGKLEMWVDMFPMDMPAPGAPVDISPRRPKSYELRCIIWNTDDVVLEDDAFFTGEKMSDIYVKGWIKGQDDMQSTDIHYRSLTGEGNFNWRFVFPFDYLVAEEKIVISRKESLFSWDESETKIPARLNLQVWDADHFSADDFLGAFTMDLNRFPRGAKSSKLCTLNMLTDTNIPHMSLFKQKRVKGWWPFAVKNESGDEYELTGKVEAELHLMTSDEAEKHPAGLGRNEPDPLEKPNRPDSSFIWFLNPLKSIRYILWHNYKWVIIKVLVVLLLTALLVLFFYSMPGYTVKKMMGA